jgi:PAS domain S-box-containing protein
MPMNNKLPRVAFTTSAFYWLGASAWIVLSDRVLRAFVSDPEQISILQTYKGWFFVTVTAFMLFLALRVQLRRWKGEVDNRRRAEDALRSSEERFALVLRVSPAAMAITRLEDGHFVDVNASGLRLFGASREELIGHPLSDLSFFVQPGELQALQERLRADGAIHDRETTFKTRAGDPRTVLISLELVQLDGGAHVLWIITDLTERKRAEEALRSSEERFDLAIKGSSDGLWDWNTASDEVYLSPRWKSMLGYLDEDLPNSLTTLEQLMHPDDRSLTMARMRDVIAGRTQKLETEYRMRHKSGYDVVILSRAFVGKRREGEPLRLVGTHVDITERKRAEEHMRSSLHEKEVMLKEIHHRVKNNLQVISSLLNLQANRVADIGMRALFRESQLRVRAMALVHEKLYRSENLASVDFREYIEAVTEEIANTFRHQRVAMRLEAEPMHLEIETAIPCGLILNELVTNALKHAFPDGGSAGEVKVTLRRKDPQSVEMSVRDNGVGLPRDIDVRQLTSMGMTLVTSLVGQINGEVVVHSNEGTEFVVTFPA